MSSSSSSEAPISALQTGQPVSASSPNPPPKRPPIPLTAAMAAVPENLDAFLAHLHRCMQTPTGIDCVLQFVCYTSRLSAAVLTSLSQNALRRSAREMVALALALPPKTAVLFASTSLSPATATSAAALVLAQRLKALSSLLSEARVILRLWGLLGMYFWARRLVLTLRASLTGVSPADGSEKDKAATPSAGATALQWAQLTTCILFQALENGAFLSSKGVMSWSPAAQGRALRWSSRFWGAFVGMELGRLAFEARHGGKAVRTAAWHKTVTRYVAWSPLIVHWSSEKGFVGEMGISLLASIPSIIQMCDLWADTAKA